VAIENPPFIYMHIYIYTCFSHQNIHLWGISQTDTFNYKRVLISCSFTTRPLPQPFFLAAGMRLATVQAVGEDLDKDIEKESWYIDMYIYKLILVGGFNPFEKY
jgi:hypothetical protein